MDAFEAIENLLPWGLHDALLTRLTIDWLALETVLDVRVATTKSQDQDRLGRLVFTGFVFCAVQAPEIDPSRGYVPTTSYGLHLDWGDGIGHDSVRNSIPQIPADSFLRWFYVQE